MSGWIFECSVWMRREEWPIPLGYTRGDADNMHAFRVGPLCISWGVRHD